MRARALHPDVIVVTSALLQVNCVLVRGDEETFVIDSPVLPEELELLPSVLSQAGFPAPSGLLATHADWDHVLAPLAFPQAPLGLAESSVERLAAEPGQAQRELRCFDEELYLERPRPLQLAGPQALPVPGHLEIGGRELELHPTGGHTGDGMAVRVPWAEVLVSGDYLSSIEIPMLNPGGSSVQAYLATLERLRPLAAAADHVVPGHGPALSAERAGVILEQDVAYLRALSGHGTAALPEGRDSREMRAVHARNLEQLA